MAVSDIEDDRSRSGSPDDSGNEQPAGNGNMSEPSKEQKPKQNGTSNAKDPSRPRRKKARRACFACQRAHLTCGDERPCQRCIKRGLQDACQDGVRKKAKYLHDAPNEALMPGVATTFNHPTKRSSTISVSETSSQTPKAQQQTPQSYFQQAQQFNNFQQPPQMPPPLLHERSMSTTSFTQQSPMSTNFSGVGSQVTLQSPVVGTDHLGNNNMNNPAWNSALFDDPSMFNFDIASMNFGNHYGALEFGMLGHMATNAGETPPSDTTTHRGSMHQPYHMPLGSFSESPTAQFQQFGDPMMTDWPNGGDGFPQHRHMAPNAFAIESGAAHWTSPDTTGTPTNAMKFEDSPLMTSNGLQMAPSSLDPSQIPPGQDHRPRMPLPPQISTPQLKAKSQLPVKSSKRPRDPSAIYTSVTSPHPYTTGFHALIAYLQKRFATHPSKTLSIAKSLASFRPSFIATTKTLNREDLIFMEKCFQRTLWEYEGFIEGVGTPTIVARRTGEVAAVGKEFQILTGWTKSVLLGRSPNLNVNRGHSGQTPGTGSGTNTARQTGFNTPTRGAALDENGENRLFPVFLAELLDDDSVVQFYEDFARLAFGDSRGSVSGKCKLLKYRTKDDELASNLNAEVEARNEDGKRDIRRQESNNAVRKGNDLKRDGISGEKGMQKLGSADGKVDCTYCWTVKRDVFDIPMLIVMNFLPCI